MMYHLQNRWKLENKRLRYYGLRNKPHMFENSVKLSSDQMNIVKKLPCDLSEAEIKTVKNLLGAQIVDSTHVKHAPSSLSEATFCKNCVANDFMIPGIEFDENGLCPICQTVEETKFLKSVVPVKNTFERSKKSRFDVGVFYTGGKEDRKSVV